jgi:hypothetical protein
MSVFGWYAFCRINQLGEIQRRGILMKSLICIFCVLLFTACINPKGTFTVSNDMTFRGPKYLFGYGKDLKISEGEYKASLYFQSKKRMILKVKTGTGEKGFTEIGFNIPKDVQYPKYSGEILLTSSQTNQYYDIQGLVDTNISESDIFHGTESCTYTIYERVCERVCKTNKEGKKKCRKVCEDIPVTYNGSQEVSYHYTYTDKEFTLNVLSPGNDSFEPIGTFFGTQHDSDKVYDYKSECY